VCNVQIYVCRYTMIGCLGLHLFVDQYRSDKSVNCKILLIINLVFELVEPHDMFFKLEFEW
jgi:hypothetical protein